MYRTTFPAAATEELLEQRNRHDTTYQE